MTKFFSYLFAGALMSSLAVTACDDDATSDDDDDSTSSSSSSGGSSGGSSSGGKTSSSSSGGTTSSSSGGSSGASSSSGGTVTLTNELSDLTFDPPAGTVGTKTTHTFTYKYTGDAPNNINVGIAPTTVPDGVTTAEQLGIDADSIALDESAPAGTVSGTFDWTPTVAGEYKFFGFFDVDGDLDTAEDQVQTPEASVEIAAD